MIGLSSYAFVWRSDTTRQKPLDLEDMLAVASELGCDTFQICDSPRLEAGDAGDLDCLAKVAGRRGLSIETGTRGVEVEHLTAHLNSAKRLGSTMVRTMLSSHRTTPSLSGAVAALRTVIPSYERAGVTLALETYEQFSTEDLVQVVRQVGSPNLGICLDPGNCVGRLERPLEVAATAAAYVVNHHVKDFDFTRATESLGFVLSGVPLGEGLLDHSAVLEILAAHDRIRGVSRIVEHWLNPEGGIEEKAATEKRVVAEAVAYLRELPIPQSPSVW